jgi:hypothetical protein
MKKCFDGIFGEKAFVSKTMNKNVKTNDKQKI